MMDSEKNAPNGASDEPVRCVQCRHFTYYENDKDHNSPHALGRCGGEPWDGNSGQWAMLRHPCKHFTAAEPQARPDQD